MKSSSLKFIDFDSKYKIRTNLTDKIDHREFNYTHSLSSNK